eukprot:scaffold48_cov311-Pinguiococcus_pyrenoidosus.AAC.156
MSCSIFSHCTCNRSALDNTCETLPGAKSRGCPKDPDRVPVVCQYRQLVHICTRRKYPKA